MARKILLADDSVTAQNMGRKILADAGYEVITVNNGSAALKKIAEHKPDLIVLDVYMPGYSGLEVCQRLKDAQETSRVPVLLTVGKLEPFKPEEAKRARADGFIVKPFEASELLSALSKLEDKIVPRPETSKPGRFARANAALDEARYDKTVAAEEDSSWKNRIAFPKKKTEPASEENDDSTFYNPMNKDLRTVVERKPVETPHEASAEEPRVDLGALAPEGLPKDVTPEEIAALAAAAAQVKGKFAEDKVEDVKAIEAKPAEVETAESRTVEPAVAARTEQQAPAPEPTQTTPAILPEVVVAALSAATFAAQNPEAKAEEKTEEKVEAASIAASGNADPMAAIAALGSGAGATPAIQAGKQDSGAQDFGTPDSGNGSWSHSTADKNDEPVTMAVAAGAAEFAASASRWSAVAVALAPEEAAISLDHEMQKAYAAFAAAESGHAGAVSTLPQSGHEAAQATAAQIPPAQTSETQTSAAQPPETQAPETQPASSQSVPAVEASFPALGATSPAATVQTEVMGPGIPVLATPIQEVERTLSAAARAATDAATEVATDAISAAVQELEAVAAAYAKEMKPAAAAPQLSPVENFKIVASPVPEAPQAAAASGSASMEQSPVPAAAAPVLEVPQAESAKPEAPQTSLEEPNQRKEQRSQQEIEEPKAEEAKAEAKVEESKNEGSKIGETNAEEVKSEPAAPVVAASAKKEEVSAAPPETPAIPAERAEVSASSSPVTSPAISTETSAKFLSSDVFSSEFAAMAFGELAAGGIGDMAKKESEIAANTAAAWANWRRIRETDPKAAAPSAEPPKEEAVAPAPQDAAMAVAAGAEQAFEEGRAVIDSEPNEIASIVDSVLADLRPKIVEEISRKMGKKK